MSLAPATETASASADVVRRTAFTLFGRFGYDGVSMTHLARECGLTKAGLYWHYESKQALYADCMRDMVGLFEAHVFAAALREDQPAHQILAAFEGLEDLLADPRVAHGVAGFWLRPATAPVDEALAVQRDFEAMARGATAQILQAAVDDGALALPLPADHHALVGLFAHMFFTSYARDSSLIDGLAKKLAAGHI